MTPQGAVPDKTGKAKAFLGFVFPLVHKHIKFAYTIRQVGGFSSVDSKDNGLRK